jgi:ribosomal protein S18 acetylase RimI-like enzyme
LTDIPSSYSIVYAPDATDAERTLVLEGLKAYNQQFVPDPRFSPLVFLLCDSNGRVAGGLVGETVWDWLHIHWLWVEEAARSRGFGRQLLAHAEREAANRGCVSCWLDTFDFQAPAFYEKAGYTAFGTLENCPPGFRRLFFQKKLV